MYAFTSIICQLLAGNIGTCCSTPIARPEGTKHTQLGSSPALHNQHAQDWESNRQPYLLADKPSSEAGSELDSQSVPILQAFGLPPIQGTWCNQSRTASSLTCMTYSQSDVQNAIDKACEDYRWSSTWSLHHYRSDGSVCHLHVWQIQCTSTQSAHWLGSILLYRCILTLACDIKSTAWVTTTDYSAMLQQSTLNFHGMEGNTTCGGHQLQSHQLPMRPSGLCDLAGTQKKPTTCNTPAVCGMM